ncbi:MAG: hypothetical protein IJZ51_07410 [Ruminiclostridium sp.]|nr:hypothetical protein [Ruminiclostridium sp.]
MNIEKIKTAVDNINEEYLLDAAEYISGKDSDMKNKKAVNANEMTIIKGGKQSKSKLAKWLPVAAVFSFAVVGVALVGVLSGGHISSSPLASGGTDTETSEGIQISTDESSDGTGVEDILSSMEEKTDEGLLWEKATNETTASGNVHYKGTYSIAGEVDPGDSSYKYVEYKGGKITIDADIFASFGEITPDKASVGYYVTINGVVQELYVGDESIGTTYIHRNNKEEIESDNAKGNFSISFTPTIAQSDKDMKEFNLCLVSIKSPDYRVSPYFASCGLNHVNHAVELWNLRTNDVAIENFADDTKLEAVNYEKTVIEASEINPGLELYDAKGGQDKIKCIGNSVSVKTVFSAGEYIGDKYRMVYLVNGAPVTLSDGRDYLEIDVEPLIQYSFDAVTINGVQPYDTIEVIGFVCGGADVTDMYSSTFMHKIIVPED